MATRSCCSAALAALTLLCAAQAAPFAYITNQGSHDVSVIDLASEQVVATVAVGRSLARIATGKNSRGFGAFIGEPLPH